MPESMSAAKHRVEMLFQRSLSQTTAVRPWILRRLQLEPRRPGLPWDTRSEGDPERA